MCVCVCKTKKQKTKTVIHHVLKKAASSHTTVCILLQPPVAEKWGSPGTWNCTLTSAFRKVRRLPTLPFFSLLHAHAATRKVRRLPTLPFFFYYMRMQPHAVFEWFISTSRVWMLLRKKLIATAEDILLIIKQRIAAFWCILGVPAGVSVLW